MRLWRLAIGGRQKNLALGWRRRKQKGSEERERGLQRRAHLELRMSEQLKNRRLREGKEIRAGKDKENADTQGGGQRYHDLGYR